MKEPNKGYILTSHDLGVLMSPEGYKRLMKRIAMMHIKYHKEIKVLNEKEDREAIEQTNSTNILGGATMENGTIDAMVILNKLQAEGVNIGRAVEYLESIISNTDRPEVSSI